MTGRYVTCSSSSAHTQTFRPEVSLIFFASIAKPCIILSCVCMCCATLQSTVKVRGEVFAETVLPLVVYFAANRFVLLLLFIIIKDASSCKQWYALSLTLTLTPKCHWGILMEEGNTRSNRISPADTYGCVAVLHSTFPPFCVCLAFRFVVFLFTQCDTVPMQIVSPLLILTSSLSLSLSLLFSLLSYFCYCFFLSVCHTHRLPPHVGVLWSEWCPCCLLGTSEVCGKATRIEEGENKHNDNGTI